MSRIFKFSLLLASICFGLSAKADHHEKVIFKELVTPILEAKCIGCHGADKHNPHLSGYAAKKQIPISTTPTSAAMPLKSKFLSVSVNPWLCIPAPSSRSSSYLAQLPSS
jgi:hypothetical protein